MFLAVTWAVSILVFVGVLWEIHNDERGPALGRVTVDIGWTIVALTLVSFWNYNPVSAVFVVTAVPVALVDYRTCCLPNVLVAQSYVVVGAAMLTSVLITDAEPVTAVRALGAALSLVAAYGVLYSVQWGLGGGDVKFAGVCGAVLGWHGASTVLVGIMVVWLGHALFFLLVRVVRRSTPGASPHGPFLVLGALVAPLVA